MMTNGKRMALIAAQAGPLGDGLEALLMTVSQIETVSQVSNASAVMAAVAQYHPALVLLDTSLPDNKVLTVLRQIKANGSQSRCLVLADDIRQQQQAKAAGADISLLKGFPPKKLVEIIEGLLSEAEDL